MKTGNNIWSNTLKTAAFLIVFVFGTIQSGHGAGVTIITHGFNDNATSGWIPAMVNAIINRNFAGDSQKVSVYQVYVTDNGSGGLTVSHSTLVGGNPLTTASGEIFVELDWHTLTGIPQIIPGDFYSTTEIATAVASKLTDPSFISDLGGQPLSSMPLHLIGHSRGGSLVCEISRLLGQQGIWVDQLTTLDPHPVCDIGSDDGPANVYENVLYADNIYQTVSGSPDCDPLDFDGPSGVYVDGANYRILTSLSGGYPVDSPVDYSAHLDVHLWYHGTIDTSASASDGTVSFTQAMRNTWYSSDESGGGFAGFYYSRLGGGLTDDNGPYFGLYNEGDFNNSPDNRVSLAVRNAGEWPAIIQFAHDSAGSVMAGNAFNIKCVFQSYDSGCSVSVYLDPDQNPFNGNQLSLPLTSAINPQPSTARGTRTINTGVTVPSTTTPGLYYVYAVVTNPYGTRYLYSLNRMLVTANNGEPGNAPTTTSVYPTSLPTSNSTQLINIYGTNFKPTGDPNASSLIFHDPANNPYVRTPIYVSANQLQYNVTVQSAIGTWSVIVTNAGLPASNPQTFTVYTPTANTGSLVVNLSPAAANSAGAQWQVDGGNYTSSGGVVANLTPGLHTVSFKSITGYTAPASHSVTITGGNVTSDTETYGVVTPASYTLTLGQAGGAGYASPSPIGTGNGETYTGGTLVQLTAYADNGFHFTGWSGDLSGTANPATITMTGNKNITANFSSGDPRLGTLVVTIQPLAAVTAGVQWGWNSADFRISGASYTTFPGSYFFSLHPVDGWISPIASDLLPVTLTAGQTTDVTVTFTQDTTPGLLTVTLSPPDAVSAGAQWHVNGGAAQGNGNTVSLAPGANYTITFDSVPGWTGPPSQTVTVTRAQTTVVGGNYTPPVGQPVIGSISPPIGAMTGGTLMTINGVNFTAPATVLIGGQPATNVTVSSTTQITCVTPSNSVYGTAPVIVQTTGGSATNLNGFAYGLVNGKGITLVGSVGGYGYAVAVSNNYAYVGEGRSLLVLDISTPSSPTKIGQVTLPGIVRGIALLNQYAYVADEEGGLQVVDVSSPTAPAIRGFYPTIGWTDGITVLGGRAYVADEVAGLEIFDLGNPTIPSLLSSINLGGTPEDVLATSSTNGMFAYVTTGASLCVIDVSNPLAPVLRGQTTMGRGGVFSIALASNNYVFGASLSDTSVHMVDVSNPNAPVDSQPFAGGYGTCLPSAVAVANNYLYAASDVSGIGFVVFSISGTNLTYVSQIANMSSTGYNMLISGSSAYIAGGASGFQNVNISNPNSPSLLAQYNDSGLFSGNYFSCAVTSNSLCGPAGEFNVFDVSQPGHATLAAELSGSGSPVVAGNGIAYLANGTANSGVQIISVSTPTSPQLIASISNTVIFDGKMQLSGNTLYVAGENLTTEQPRFIAVNVSNPSSPVVSCTKDFTEFSSGLGSLAISVAVNGSKALVGIHSSSGVVQLNVLDISNLSAPVEEGSLNNIGYPYDIRMSADGNYAYVMDVSSNSVLRIVDVSSPTSPFLVASIPLDSTLGQELQMRSNELYAATTGGIYVFDVTNPTAPALTRSYSMSGINGINIPTDSGNESGYIYVADGNGGILVLREVDIQAPEVFITSPTSTSVYTNTTGTLNLGGTADDNLGLVHSAVTQVTWANSQGGAGNASGTTNWSVSGITLLPGTNILTVTASDASGNSSNTVLTAIYLPPAQTQTIVFSSIADQTFGDPPIPLVASASSGLLVTFSVISGAATLSNNVLTLTGAGTVTVEADQSGNSSFNTATPVDVSFNVAPANQSISFGPVPDQLADASPFALTATANSGLPVYFNILYGPAVYSNNLVTLLGEGSVTVIAWQPGNSNFNAAATVQQSFAVAGVPQTITFGPLSQQTSGDAPFPLAATVSSGLPVSFSIVSGPAQLSGNIVTLMGAGTITVSASQPGDSVYAAAPSVMQSFSVVSAVSPVTPPAVTSPQLLPDGSFQMTFYGVIGTNYTFQASTDLKNWMSLFSFTCTNSPMYLVDTNATQYAYRFYRIAQFGTSPTISLGFGLAQPWTANGLSLMLQGPVGSNYIIQASTDLMSWQPITNFTTTTSPFYFTDPAAANYDHRFYRGMMP